MDNFYGAMLLAIAAADNYTKGCILPNGGKFQESRTRF